MTKVTSSGLNESDPVPTHVPLRAPLLGPGTGPEAGGLGAGSVEVGAGLGAVGTTDDIDPQAATHAASAPGNNKRMVLMSAQCHVTEISSMTSA